MLALPERETPLSTFHDQKDDTYHVWSCRDNFHPFYGSLPQYEGSWLSRTSAALRTLLWQAWTTHQIPDPTKDQIWLYIQVRNADYTHKVGLAIIPQLNAVEFGLPQVRDNLVARLDLILTPAQVPEDAPECSLCLANFGDPDIDGHIEEPVACPCGHVYGRKCLENWVLYSWSLHGPPCRICGLCDKDFGFMNVEGRVAGPIPWWFRMLKEMWGDHDDQFAADTDEEETDLEVSDDNDSDYHGRA